MASRMRFDWPRRRSTYCVVSLLTRVTKMFPIRPIAVAKRPMTIGLSQRDRRSSASFVSISRSLRSSSLCFSAISWSTFCPPRVCTVGGVVSVLGIVSSDACSIHRSYAEFSIVANLLIKHILTNKRMRSQPLKSGAFLIPRICLSPGTTLSSPPGHRRS
jgi:hypothetical protein